MTDADLHMLNAIAALRPTGRVDCRQAGCIATMQDGTHVTTTRVMPDLATAAWCDLVILAVADSGDAACLQGRYRGA
jgi:hypothetical protein